MGPSYPLVLSQSPSSTKNLGDRIDAFVKAGGEIKMCPHCSEYCGVTQDSVTPGAKIVEPGGLAQLVFAADKVLDY